MSLKQQTCRDEDVLLVIDDQDASGIGIWRHVCESGQCAVTLYAGGRFLATQIL